MAARKARKIGSSDESAAKTLKNFRWDFNLQSDSSCSPRQSCRFQRPDFFHMRRPVNLVDLSNHSATSFFLRTPATLPRNKAILKLANHQVPSKSTGYRTFVTRNQMARRSAAARFRTGLPTTGCHRHRLQFSTRSTTTGPTGATRFVTAMVLLAPKARVQHKEALIAISGKPSLCMTTQSTLELLLHGDPCWPW